MSRRMFEVLGVAAVLVAVVLVLKFDRSPVDARATAGGGTLAAASAEPDLQGIWTRDTNEPLQRPAMSCSSVTLKRLIDSRGM